MVENMLAFVLYTRYPWWILTVHCPVKNDQVRGIFGYSLNG